MIKLFIIFVILLLIGLCIGFAYTMLKIEASSNTIEFDKTESFKMMTSLEKNIVVIVEPRKHKAMRFVLQNLLENQDWDIQIFHGYDNKHYILDILDDLLYQKERIHLTLIKVDNLSIKDYNNLLTSKSFYDNILCTDMILIAQTDSMVCPGNYHLLEKFMEFEYVGAPWSLSHGVGNGGFSLRRKDKILEMLEKCPYSKRENEDIYFANGCKNFRLKKPKFDQAKWFSQEQIISGKSFGIHLCKNNKKDNTKKNCKGIEELISLNTLD